MTQNNCERRDSDGFEANEFYVVLDKVYKYDPDCDLDECIDFELEHFKIKKDFQYQNVKYQKLHSTNGMDDIKSEDALQTGSVDIEVTEGVESNYIAHYGPAQHTFIGHEADSQIHKKRSDSEAVYNHVLNGDSVSVKYKDCFDFTSYEPLNDDMSTSLEERSHDNVNGGYSSTHLADYSKDTYAYLTTTEVASQYRDILKGKYIRVVLRDVLKPCPETCKMKYKEERLLDKTCSITNHTSLNQVKSSNSRDIYTQKNGTVIDVIDFLIYGKPRSYDTSKNPVKESKSASHIPHRTNKRVSIS